MVRKKYRLKREILILSVLLSSLLLYAFPMKAFCRMRPPSIIKALSKANKKRVGIGERFRYATTVYTGPNIEVEFPKDLKALGDFEIKDSGISQRSLFGKEIMMQWYLLAIYDIGEQVIPPSNIRWRHRGGEWSNIRSNKVVIDGRTIFEKVKIGASIKSIEPPISFVWVYKFHFIAALILLVLILYSVFLFLKKRKKMLEEIRRGPPADEIIYQRLSSAITSLGPKAAIGKDLFIEISQLTRAYLEERLKLGAREMTTEEFLDCIKANKAIPVKYSQFLNRFFKRCDLAKFANYIPTEEESAKDISMVQDLLKEIKPEEGIY